MSGTIRLDVRGPRVDGLDAVLTPAALDFIAELAATFGPKRSALLEARRLRQAARDKGERLDFLAETAAIRGGDWRVAPLPKDLQDRRVEITGPVDRKMIINALNSGASVFMADFEDSTAPSFANLIDGQKNLMDAVRRTITYVAPETQKSYALNPKTAVLMVRPRGWHLPEKHVLQGEAPISGSLFDLGLYFFHNARALLERGTGPYFYLPKMEHHLEARLWNEVLSFCEERLSIPRGTAKATVLIETLPAAFQMDEILWELREHSAGLNCGRWDYIFSFIKTQRADKNALIPDRALVTMTQPFMRAYTQLLVKTCHRRGVHAMGGMAAQIPIKNDPAANEHALQKVRADKLREVTDGHDGTWVAHPGLVPIAKAIFDEHMPAPNQIETKPRDDVHTTAADLLAVPTGTRSEEGLRHSIRVGVQYLEAWLSGLGCVPLYNLMEDAATAEISRTQVWQWLKHGAVVDGKVFDVARMKSLTTEEMARVRQEIGPPRYDSGRFEEAIRLFTELSTSPELADFLTLAAYARLD
ncbi:MAG: malate synthase A [Myxococcota bacterium]